MYKQKSILGLIPAREGSKRLPGKNTKRLLDNPLIARTISAALKSRYLDRVVVSTESKKIAAISQKFGAEVPFLRPKKLATDRAKMKDVVLHAMQWLEKNNGQGFDLIMLLQPTSPLRVAADIDKAIEWIFLKNAKGVISVCRTEYHPYLSNTLPKSMSMRNFIRQEAMNKNTQELPICYRLNGAIYLAYWQYFKKQEGFFGNGTVAYIMPQERSVDIDTKADFRLCEFLLKEGKMIS